MINFQEFFLILYIAYHFFCFLSGAVSFSYLSEDLTSFI